MRGNVWIISLFLMLLALAAASLGYYYYFYETVPDYSVLPPREAHFYKDPATSIKNIRAKVFYAVPSNKKELLDEEWKETITDAFQKIAEFHRVQFRGASELDFDVFPQPVFLEKEDSFYNTDSTDFGNPRGLIAVAEEIDKRVMDGDGDMHDAEFAEFGAGDYPIMGLIYEGVGASGGVIYETEQGTPEEISGSLGIPESMIFITDVASVKGFFILNREFLIDGELSIFGPTLLYHELAHAFGAPDRGDSGDLKPQNDIMGLGRRDAIEAAYIGNDILKELGVLD